MRIWFSITALLLALPPTHAIAGQDPKGLHFESAGNGPPLILLHSFGWSGRQWAPFIPELAKTYRVLAIDLPGHGGSPGWETMKSFSYPDAARQVLALLDSLGIRGFKAIGASSGAITLLEIASQAPGRVEAMMIVGSATRIPDKTRAWLKDNACKEDSAEELAKMREYQPGGEPQIRALGRLFCAQKDDTESISKEQLARIKARTLVAHGDRDPIFPVEGAVETYRSIAGASLWVHPGGGHVFVLKPEVKDEFLATAGSFLAGQR